MSRIAKLEQEANVRAFARKMRDDVVKIRAHYHDAPDCGNTDVWLALEGADDHLEAAVARLNRVLDEERNR